MKTRDVPEDHFLSEQTRKKAMTQEHRAPKGL